MIVGRSSLISILLLLPAYALAAMSTTTSVNSSCVVDYDLANTIYYGLDAFLQPYLSAVTTLSTMLDNDVNHALFQVPESGNINQIYAKVNASTTRQILFSLYGNVPGRIPTGFAPNVQIVSINGYLVDYGYSPVRAANGEGDGTAFVIGPVSTQLSPMQRMGNGIPYYTTCNQTTYYYYTNPTNGYMTKEFYATNQNNCQKNWYYPALSTSNVIWSLPYFGSTTNSLIYALAQRYNSSQSHENGGVVEVSLVLSFLSEYIANMNTQANTVGYIMTYNNPVGLLVATTVGLALNTTTYATKSSNHVIKQTSQYIFTNNILTDMSGYIESAGCYMSVKFYSSPNGVNAIYANLNKPSAPATGQANWIIVSCNVEANPTTSYTVMTDDMQMDDDDTVQTQVQATLGLVSMIFIYLTGALIAGGVYVVLMHMKSTPLAASGTTADATAKA